MSENAKVVLLIIVLLVLFFIISIPFIIDIFNNLTSYYNEIKNKYDISSATIIDTHIGYSRFGTPHYYFVYKFSSGYIEQIEVSAEEYYKNRGG